MAGRMVALMLALCCVAGAARAAAAPQIMTTIGGERPLRLQSLDIDGSVSGGMALTRVRMVFFNPNQRALEGRLQFPLLPGQRITAFALDVEGQLRPAVPVEKAKGRQIVEQLERRRVDPALLEQTQGNNFQLRVYPIAAQGTRTVELTYAEPLEREGANWAYRLPLAYGEVARGLNLRLQLNGADAAPQASGTLAELAFARRAGGYEAQIVKEHVSLDGTLKLLLPASAEPRSFVQQFDGATYFMAEVPLPPLPLPLSLAAPRGARVLPKVVGLLWDSSGSGANRAHAAELVELERYFKALGDGEVRLTRLRDRAEATLSYKVVNGNWDALRKALQDTVYDGASALADWRAQADVGEYLLVSDGLLNYGGQRFPELKAGQRLYALNSALSADSGRLAALAERTGGRLVQIRADLPGAAAQALLSEGVQLRAIRANGASEVLSAPVDAVDGQPGLLRLAGKLTSPTAQLQLTLQQQGRPVELNIELSSAAPQHALAAQLWAGYKLHQLEADYELHRAAIRRLGTQFGMPTRETSLLVLDTLEDYVRYDVAPPAQYLAAFESLEGLRRGDLAQRRGKQLERVVRAFEQKVAWWEKSYPKDFLYRLPPKPGMAEEPADDMPPLPAPRPLARPAPAPSWEREKVVVGGSRVTQGDLAYGAPAPAGPAAESAVVAAATNFLHRAESKSATSGTSEIGVSLQKWRADAPYIARLQAAGTDRLYAIYLDERPSYTNSSAFFLDVADLLFERGQRELALRVLSNLAEMDLENRQVLRILGYRLMQAGAPELAIGVFEKVRELAEEEPQSFRDLGLAHAAAGHAQQAVDQLYEVVLRPWDQRFAEIELIALAELNAIVANAPRKAALDTSRIDPRLLKNMPLDLRAVLSWDADNSDMDLWVTDPNGERCFYGKRFSYQGGRMSLDFTGGYGPEEFSLRHAKPGKYRIEANFYGSTQQLVAAATTLQLRLSGGFGGGAAQDKLITLRLKGRGETVLVGEFEVKPK
ncbi:VIT domain-containing protein [Rugamonas sp. DEMB1]|uniref:VIT domain-containing protein n=1 Tax=Rugamonas sp. DEMB1 TaxID=3039386 RepID=UPI00244C20B1|nr:VIT domain-containing protein [Rugamonas sp. DEMB1]WGG48632.1 VIT domain-containing protein [Rugamonas sp. DEMB1]